MSSPSILIFGAGINQLTLIQAARDLGLCTVVLDPAEKAPGRDLADFFYALPGDDYEGARAIAVKHQVAGIVTGQMEKPMRLMARLAQELGFRFHTPEVTERSLDKWLMKEAFLRSGVPCAAGVLLSPEEEGFPERMSMMHFPLIIKPKDATSSQGVLKVNSREELEAFLPAARGFSRSGQVIVEEFLEGPEFSVEAITYQGHTTVVQITEKFVTPFPYTVEMGHLQPAPLSREDWSAIEQTVAAAVSAIGIDHSASHTELKLTARGPRVIEIGARLGGDFISSYLVTSSCGVSMDRAAVQVALGLPPDLSPVKNRFSYIKYFALPPGRRVLNIGNWEDLRSRPGVVFAHLNLQEGDLVPEVTESRKRSGLVIVEGESRAEVIALAENWVEEMSRRISTAPADLPLTLT